MLRISNGSSVFFENVQETTVFYDLTFDTRNALLEGKKTLHVMPEIVNVVKITFKIKSYS